MNVRAALEFCASEGPPGRFSCVHCVSRAIPETCDLREAYDVFVRLTPVNKMRCAQNVEAGARLVARKIAAKRVEAAGTDDAWGVVNGGKGRVCFAFRSAGIWYARSERGLMKMHVSTVRKAWELK